MVQILFLICPSHFQTLHFSQYFVSFLLQKQHKAKMIFKFLPLVAVVAGTLPIFHLEAKGGQYFDLPVELGSPPQQLHLRLDVLQGDLWVPDYNYFTPCNAESEVSGSQSSSSSTKSTETTKTTSSSSSSSTTLPPRLPDRTSLTTTITQNSTDSDTANSDYQTTVAVATFESTSSSSSLTNNCAAGGVYINYGSLYSAYINIFQKIVVGYAGATEYVQTYLSTIFVNGVWYTDSMNIQVQNGNVTDGLKLWDVPFVLCNSSNVSTGALALGYSQLLDNVETNFISNFVDNEIIDSNSYSLALSANNGTDPQLILGGVIGDLITDDGLSQYSFVEIENEELDKDNNNIPSFPIFGWGVTSRSTGESVVFSDSYNDRMSISSYPKPAVLDSRHAYNYIPYSTLVEMAIELNAYYLSDLNVWITDCSIGDIGTIDMYLADNFTIKMPISNFIFPISINGTGLTFESGGSACALAFLPDYRVTFSVMGTPFIKSAYIAVDNDNKQIAIGNLKGLLSDDDSRLDKRDILETDHKEDVVDEINDGDDNIENKIVSAHQTIDDNKEIVIGGGSSDDLTVTRSGTLVTVNGSTLTDYGFVFTESYAKPPGPNLSTSTFNGTELFTVTNRDRTVLVTAATTYSTEEYTLPTDATSTMYSSYLPITSGTIPLASKYTDSTFTLTIPNTVSYTDSLAMGNSITISGGEIVFETGLGQNGIPLSTDANSSERDTTIYAFSSLVTSISKPSAAGNSISVNKLHSLWWVWGLICLL